MGVRQAALAVVAVVVAVANSGVEAARYEDNLLTEFTFSQAECKTRAFADSVAEDYLGGLTYPSSWATLTKCPTYTDGDGTVFEYAYNGMHSVGARYLASGSGTNLTLDDSAKSASTVASLLAELDGVGDFALEFWIVPSFTSGGGVDKYVLFEVGAEPSSGEEVGEEYIWECGSGSNFDFQLYYQDNTVASSRRFELSYQESTGACDSLAFDATSLVAGTLYHVVITGTLDVDETVWTLYVDNTNIDDKTREAISFSNFDSSHVLRLGSSPATLSSSTSGGIPDYHSFPGDILHFSFYNES
ncbi:Hypothetical Protein FCC1311_114942, partial [Hondaea fermentalgiana]